MATVKISGTTWTGIAAGVLAIGAIVIGVSRQEPDAGERNATVVSDPKIEIVTENSVPLTFQYSSAAVDICGQKKQGVWIDKIFDAQYIAETKALGFQRMMVYSDGAITNVNHVALPPAIGKGYNGQRTDFKTQAEFEAEMGGILAATGFTQDFFTKTTTFIKTSLGLPADVCLNPNDTWLQNKYRIETTGAEYIFLGSEEVSTKVPKSWTPQTYLAWAKPMVDSIRKHFPNKKIIADQVQMWKDNKPALLWRRDITPTTLPNVYGADPYWQIGDILRAVVHDPYSANQDSNLIRSKYFFDSIVPQQITQFQTEFPGWKLIAGEVLIEDADAGDDIPLYVRNNMCESYTISRFFKMFIEYQAIQPMAIQMSLNGLKIPTEVRTQSYTMLNKLLKPIYNVTTLSFLNMSGVEGVSLNEAANQTKHALLIMNTSNATYTLPNVKVNGKKKTANFKIQRQYGNSWASLPTRDSITSSTLTILPFSTNVVTFDTNPPSPPTQPSQIR